MQTPKLTRLSSQSKYFTLTSFSLKLELVTRVKGLKQMATTVFVFKFSPTLGQKIKGIRFSALASVSKRREASFHSAFGTQRGCWNFSYSPKAGVFGK